MDLLFKKYASPFSLLDLMLQSNRFNEFVDEVIDAYNDELLWQMYLSLLANPFYENNKSFDEFKKQLKEQTIQEPNNKITEKEIEATINHSKEILNGFNPYE